MADEYPASSRWLFQISEPSAFFKATIEAAGAPALTRIRSLMTSGDSLNPHVML